MKIKAKALKAFNHDELGRVTKGQEFEATEAQLSGVMRFVELIEAKVVRQPPTPKPIKHIKKAD